MNDASHSLAELVIHRLVRAADGPSRVELGTGVQPLDDAAARLMERLCRHFAERPGKGYGCFEAADAPMAILVGRYVQHDSLDFAAFSRALMDSLQTRLDAHEVQEGGYVLLARVTVFGADCIYVALMQETLGSVIGAGLEILDSPHLDFAGLQVAGRIDLSAWQAGAERYVSFLKGRGDVAGWFKEFLGCADVVIALKETKKLVETLSHFADTRQLQAEERDALLERAHGVLEEMGEGGVAVSLDEMAARICPEASEALGASLKDESLHLASGFVPDKRALRPLIRFKASAQDWKLEFERSGLRSGAVHYDRDANTLILSNIPDSLKRLLLEE